MKLNKKKINRKFKDCTAFTEKGIKVKHGKFKKMLNANRSPYFIFVFEVGSIFIHKHDIGLYV